MEHLTKVVNSLNQKNHISIEDIPDIDLYMDQVIQLFENKFSGAKRNSDEKVLTKTMINNYAKGKLFFPIKNKKYSKEHLILISLIYQLKGALSINDIKDTLQGLNEMAVQDEVDLAGFYNSFLSLTLQNAENFTHDIKERAQEAKAANTHKESGDRAYLEQVLLIASLVNISNLYRRTAEKLVDELIAEDAAKAETP